VHCYAEAWAKRTGHRVWGAHGQRRTFGEPHWAEPLAWNAAARRAGERRRVFCASMADVFEDHPALSAERAKLWALIRATPWLDWQLLTKRVENVLGMTPETWSGPGGWPGNVWIGTSVESRQWANKRIPVLLQIPARVRFLSCEPLLERVDLRGIEHPSEALIDCLDGAIRDSKDGVVNAATPNSVNGAIGGGRHAPVSVHDLQDLQPSPEASRRVCGWCDGPIPPGARSDAIYCKTSCRQAAHRFGKGRALRAACGRPLRLAYADPPYPGRAA